MDLVQGRGSRPYLRVARRSFGPSLVACLLGTTVLVFMAPAAHAHAPHDVIGDVAVSPSFAQDHTVFVTSGSRLLRSTDDGSNWVEIVRGLPEANLFGLDISPSDQQVMFMSSQSDGIFRSHDGGWSWEPASNGLAQMVFSGVAISPISSEVVLATDSYFGLLYRTVDGGDSWTQVSGIWGVAGLAFVPDGTGRAVVGTTGGRVLVSDDDGATWTETAAIDPPDKVTAIGASIAPAGSATVFAGTDTGRVLGSVDSGDSFTEVGSGLPEDNVRSIAVSGDFDSNQTVWLSTWTEGVFRSIDGGDTWISASTGLTTDPQADAHSSPHFRDLGVATDAGDADVLFLGGFDGLFRSDDGADMWAPIETLSEYVVGLAVSPAFAVDSSVAATTYVKGAYLSQDGGDSWQGIHDGLGQSPGAGNKFAPVTRMHNVVFSPDYANDGTIFSASWDRFLIYKSTDHGATWVRNRVGPTPPEQELKQFVIALSPDFAADQTIYVGTRQGEIFKSTQGGEDDTWTEISNVGSQVRSLVMSPSFPASPDMFVSTVNGVYKSTDAGNSWAPTGPTGIALLAISPSYDSDGTVFAGTESGVFVTRNAGIDWAESTVGLPPAGHVEAVGVSPGYETDGMVLVSVTGSGLYRSTDGGASFVEIAADLIAANLQIADFDRPTSAPIQFSPAFASDQTVFAMAGQHVLRSTDGGDSWALVDLPPAASLLAPPVIAAAARPTIIEGGPGASTVARIPFDLSHPFATVVRVDWTTVDVPSNPAVASSTDGDYVPASGTLVFTPGSTREYAEIEVSGDSLDEIDEGLVVATHDPVNGTIGGFYGLGFATIEDDDPLPVVVPSVGGVAEGDVGTTILQVPVTLSAPSGKPVSVEWETVDSLEQPEAGIDYEPASGTVTFAPGASSASVAVTVYGDTLAENTLWGAEWGAIRFHSPTNATVGTGFDQYGLALIVDDD